MNPWMWGRALGAALMALALVACDATIDDPQAGARQAAATNDDPPDEGVILLEETVHIVERSGMYSIPTDPLEAMAAIATLPDGLGDVIAMHLGRYYPTPHEFAPAVAPLTDLLQARANLLLGGGQLTRMAEDTMDGEFSVLLLPVDATSVIVILPTQVVQADPAAPDLPATPIDLSQLTYEVNGRTRTIEQYMQSGQTNAIAFMHNGQFIYEAYQNLSLIHISEPTRPY